MLEAVQRPPVGVLVVHGIGAQKPGETLTKLANGLRRVFPELPQKLADGEAATLGEHSVRLYEVYWADLLMGERVRGTLDLDEVWSLAWFPLFNQLRRAYAKEPYLLWTVLRWTIILPLVGFALLMTYWGARLLAQLWEGLRERLQDQAPAQSSGKTFVEVARQHAYRAAHGPTAIEKLLDEYVGDVLNYINSAGNTFTAKRQVPKHLCRIYRDVLDRFYDQLVRAHRDDGCQSIQIIAHSLGTVATYYALRGLRLDESARPDKNAITEAVRSIDHLYTIGSPLEKIRFFWPRLRPEQNLVGKRMLAWDNFVSYFDPIAGLGGYRHRNFLLMALLVPFLVSLPFRAFYGPETWGPILDYASAFFVVLFLVVFSVAPWNRARETFKRLGNGSASKGAPNHGP